MIYVLILILLIASSLLLYYFGRYLYRKYKNYKKLSPLQAEHLRKEKEMIQHLLTDIADNTNDWFLSHDHAVAAGLCIINDRKNIGLVYRAADVSTLTVHLNLKSLQNFSPTEKDTVILTMAGPHVSKFISQAENIIDKRGNELEFFKSELHKKL